VSAVTTRDKLIKAGHEIFYREGFLLVGLDRLLKEVGCSKQTFYNHFDSKDDLIVAVIDEHHRWWSRELRDRIQRAAGPDPRGQMLAIFDVMQEIINDPEYHGCIHYRNPTRTQPSAVLVLVLDRHAVSSTSTSTISLSTSTILGIRTGEQPEVSLNVNRWPRAFRKDGLAE
jgi:AcrR family transcriptional regulator